MWNLKFGNSSTSGLVEICRDGVILRRATKVAERCWFSGTEEKRKFLEARCGREVSTCRTHSKIISHVSLKFFTSLGFDCANVARKLRLVNIA